MRPNSLQALFLKDCRYAYYVHCLAHQLQLALIAAAREVAEVHDFFKDLNLIVNTVSSSSKRHDELQERQVAELENLIEIEEVETGKGLNQIGTLQRPGDTRWSSHYKSICSVIRMFNATRTIFEKIATDRRATYSQRGDSKSSLKKLLSFDFVFILHLMEELMRLTDGLCGALQHKSQDILNVMHLVGGTKSLIQKFRDDGWESLLQKMNNCKNLTTELVSKQQSLLILSASLSPVDGYKDFNVENICLLAEKYYPKDFSEQEIFDLRNELDQFYYDIPNHPDMKSLTTIADLCRSLVEKRKSIMHPLVDRLI